VSCALGIHQIGYVMICFGVVNAICSVIFGSLMKYVGRFSIIVFGTVIHMGIFSYLLFWRPHPENPLVFFVISGLWGVGDAVWQTQINGKNLIALFVEVLQNMFLISGLYGTLFRRNKEAAFSNYRFVFFIKSKDHDNSNSIKFIKSDYGNLLDLLSHMLTLQHFAQG
jgi:MFS family permease